MLLRYDNCATLGNATGLVSCNKPLHPLPSFSVPSVPSPPHPPTHPPFPPLATGVRMSRKSLSAPVRMPRCCLRMDAGKIQQ